MVSLNIKLPENFLDEEIRDDYVVSSQMKQVWAVELDLLNKILEVCKKYNIKIIASGGTLLGAVRHKGFIPWDDDIDLMMMRNQYDKLCDVAEKEFTYPYFFQTEYTDPGSMRGHAQLRNSQTTGILNVERGKCKFNQGIFIDIFPLDRVVDDNFLFQKQKKKALYYKSCARKIANITVNYDLSENTGVKKIIKKMMHKIFGKILEKSHLERYFYKKFEDTWKKYNDRDTVMCSSLTFAEACEAHFKKVEYFKEIVELPFEFMSIPVCYRYEELLTQRYGNWRKIEKGTSCHGTVFFDTSVSYEKYVKGNKKL